jgi:hypothetical protein
MSQLPPLGLIQETTAGRNQSSSCSNRIGEKDLPFALLGVDLRLSQRRHGRSLIVRVPYVALKEFWDSEP